MTLDRRVLPSLSIGLEYNPVVGEFVPRGNLYLQTETDSRPALIAGSSSDRIGTPEGNQAYFLTASKRIPGTPFAPYLGINYSEFDRGLNFPFGLTLNLHEKWSVLGMYDGQRSHLLLNYRAKGYVLSLMWIWLERVGVSFSTGF
jgi:hypothetical protein